MKRFTVLNRLFASQTNVSHFCRLYTSDQTPSCLNQIKPDNYHLNSVRRGNESDNNSSKIIANILYTIKNKVGCNNVNDIVDNLYTQFKRILLQILN